MQEQSISASAEDQDKVEHAVLDLLLSSDLPGLWSVEEVQREIGKPLAVSDSLAHLTRTGLVHRCGEFVFPTRAAVRADQLQR
jgi:hypothetical protein